MLKEMLKIDGARTGSPSSQGTTNSSAPSGQPQNRRRSSKKLGRLLIISPQASLLLPHLPCHTTLSLFPPFSVSPAANMNASQSDASANITNALLNNKVSELAHVCVGLGMAPPEFSYIGNRTVTACNSCSKNLKKHF